MDRGGLALARVRDDLPLSLACALLLTLVAAGVAGLLAIDAAARDAAVRSRVEQLPPQSASLTVGTSETEEVTDQGPAAGEQDAVVREDAARAFGDLAVTVRASARSSQRPVLAPSAQGAATVVLLVAEDLADLADVVDGSWAGGPDQVAVQADAAASLGVVVGDPIQVEGPDGAPVEVTVSGTWRVRPEAESAVGGDPLLLTGRQSTSAVGPVVPADPALLGAATRVWWVVPDLDGLDLEAARSLPGATRTMVDVVTSDPRLGAVRTSTGLTDDLTEVVRAAGSTGAAGRVVLLLVAVASLTALLVVASLLVQRRAGHTALLRARGTSWSQVVVSTVAETAVLVLPALVLAVVLAVAVPERRVSAVALAGCALAASVVLALPTVLGARRWESVREKASGRRSTAVRAGGELVVVVGAGLSLWQLRRQGGATTVQDGGQDGGLLDRADLVVVAAPVLGLLAGALLAARLVAPVASVVARTLRRRPGLPALMAAWQTSRAPGPDAVAVLLVVVLVGTGVLVVGTASTREAELARVAQQRVGADVRVVADRALGADPDEAVVEQTALAAVEGVRSVRGVRVEPASTSGGPVSVVAVGGAPAQDGEGPAVGAGEVQVPWSLEVTSGSALPDGFPVDDAFAPGPGTVVVAATTWWVSSSGYPLARDLGSQQLTTVLDETVTARTTATIELPTPPGGTADRWRLVALDVDGSNLGASDQELTVSVLGLTGPDGELVAGSAGWASPGAEPGSGAGVGAGDLPVASLAVTFGFAPTAGVRIVAADLAAGASTPVPATVTRALLAAAGVEVGDPLLVRRVQGLRTEVVGSVGSVDGVEGEAVVVDQRALVLLDLAAGRDPAGPGQWEVDLSTASGSPQRDQASSRVAVAAADTGLPVTVVDRDALEAVLAADPLSSGTARTGLLGGLVIALLTLAGLLAGGAVSARRRLRDDTVLRVLGADAGQQRRADLVRTLVVGGLAVLAGLATGYVVLVLTGPALVGDPTALGRPAGVDARVRWPDLALVALVGAVLAALPVLARDPAGRRGVAARMRFEEPA